MFLNQFREGSFGYYAGFDAILLAQRKLNSLGANISEDGDFGPNSCRALQSYIGPVTCNGMIDRASMQKLVAVKASNPVPHRVSDFLPFGTPKSQYDFALNLFGEENYTMAEGAFFDFVDLHPKDDLVNEARYWLGETYYLREAYVQSAQTFLEGYELDPKGG